MSITYGHHITDFPNGKNRAGYFYAVEDGQVIAICTAEPWDVNKRPFLSMFHVNKDRRGKGVGSKLIDQIVLAASGLNIRSLALYVNQNNARAISFYRRHSFHDFYQDDDNILMGRRLCDEQVAKPIAGMTLEQFHEAEIQIRIENMLGNIYRFAPEYAKSVAENVMQAAKGIL